MASEGHCFETAAAAAAATTTAAAAGLDDTLFAGIDGKELIFDQNKVKLLKTEPKN